MSRDGTPAKKPLDLPDERRLLLTRAIITCGLAAGLALSPRLWHGGRSYPAAPIWNGLPDVPNAFAVALYAALFGLIAVSLTRLKSTWPIFALLCLAGAWSLWDQSRWQPWFYQYLAMLLCLGLAQRKTADLAQQRVLLNACRLIVAGTYFWSGVQKANASFVQVVYPWLAEPFFGNALGEFQSHLAYALPPLEAALGLALLVPRLRWAAVALLTLMHATILFSIGPPGHNWNNVVWPWNLAMPAAAAVLFLKLDDVSLRDLAGGRWSSLHRAVVLLFWLLPALSFWGWWDAYLSASLYSGNIVKGHLEIAADVRQRLPQSAQDICQNTSHGRYLLPLADWSMEDLNVPAYPSDRVFHRIHQRFCRDFAQPGDHVALLILARPSWRSTDRVEQRFDQPTP